MRVDTLIMGKPRPSLFNFWKDPLGPWNLQTFEPTGTQEPFIPLTLGPWSPKKETLHPLDPETVGFWKHQTLESPVNLGRPSIPRDPKTL